MTEKDDLILDQPEHEKPPKDRWRFIAYISLAIFLAGAIGLVLRHPVAPILMAAGLALGHVRTTLHFVAREKFNRVAVCFFAGRSLLVFCFLLWLLSFHLSFWVLGATALSFLLAIYFSRNEKDSEFQDEAE